MVASLLDNARSIGVLVVSAASKFLERCICGGRADICGAEHVLAGNVKEKGQPNRWNQLTFAMPI